MAARSLHGRFSASCRYTMAVPAMCLLPYVKAHAYASVPAMSMAEADKHRFGTRLAEHMCAQHNCALQRWRPTLLRT